MAGTTQTLQQKKISPAVRNQLFAALTRKYHQPLPPVAGAENATAQFTLTKSRLLSKIWLEFLGTMTYTQAAAAPATLAPFAPFNFIRNVRVEYNNGYTPFNISGAQLYMYNLARNNATLLTPRTTDVAATAALLRGRCACGLESGAGGVANVCRFLLELPIGVNERDPVGLYLLQNEEIVVTVTIDFDDANVVFNASAGLTGAMTAISVTPVVETFSVPPRDEAVPDLGMLKLVSARHEVIAGAGTQTIRLTPGNIFRKLLVYIEDATAGEFDGDLTGNFEIIFNESDNPIRIPPWVLSGINAEQYGLNLPNGLWVFDFTYQGLANYGGGRDYIDTEKVTEFWFRFNAAAAGTIDIVQETLTKLR